MATLSSAERNALYLGYAQPIFATLKTVDVTNYPLIMLNDDTISDENIQARQVARVTEVRKKMFSKSVVVGSPSEQMVNECFRSSGYGTRVQEVHWHSELEMAKLRRDKEAHERTAPARKAAAERFSFPACQKLERLVKSLILSKKMGTISTFGFSMLVKKSQLTKHELQSLESLSKEYHLSLTYVQEAIEDEE